MVLLGAASAAAGVARARVSEACGSRSTSSTLRPRSARPAPKFMAVVVLPTPPFWLATAMTRVIAGSRTALGQARLGVLLEPGAGAQHKGLRRFVGQPLGRRRQRQPQLAKGVPVVLG